MKDSFDECFALLLKNEGGYSNNPNDPGHETMYGVTIKIARQWGYTGAMKDLPLATAEEIAKAHYWTPFSCALFPAPIAFQIFDTAYNGGHPVQWLQEIATSEATGQELADIIGFIDVWEVVARFNAKRLRYLASLRQAVFANGRMVRIATNLEQGNLV